MSDDFDWLCGSIVELGPENLAFAEALLSLTAGRENGDIMAVAALALARCMDASERFGMDASEMESELCAIARKLKPRLELKDEIDGG